VTALHGGQTCTTTDAITCIVTGLTNGHLYNVKVQASNAIGLGKAARVQVRPSNAQNCTYIGPYANLQQCDLNRTNLTGANLTGANLTGANLAYDILTSVDLSGAELSGANLNDVSSGGIVGMPSALPASWSLVSGYLIGPLADLASADLSGADLSGADLNEAELLGADLTDANFTGSALSFSYMANANLTGATLTGATLLDIFWSNTTCPDGTNSNNDGDTCANNLG
jgi:uncharacterized protein YjbI with pentapeptide repeats